MAAVTRKGRTFSAAKGRPAPTAASRLRAMKAPGSPDWCSWRWTRRSCTAEMVVIVSTTTQAERRLGGVNGADECGVAVKAHARVAGQAIITELRRGANAIEHDVAAQAEAGRLVVELQTFAVSNGNRSRRGAAGDEQHGVALHINAAVQGGQLVIAISENEIVIGDCDRAVGSASVVIGYERGVSITADLKDSKQAKTPIGDDRTRRTDRINGRTGGVRVNGTRSAGRVRD